MSEATQTYFLPEVAIQKQITDFTPPSPTSAKTPIHTTEKADFSNDSSEHTSLKTLSTKNDFLKSISGQSGQLRPEFDGVDIGIDLVAQERDGGYHSVQVLCGGHTHFKEGLGYVHRC